MNKYFSYYYFRQIAFETASDLTNVLKDAGHTNLSSQQNYNPGAPNDEMYLRQAEHLMKRGAYEPALIYLHQSLTMNPQSLVNKPLCILNFSQF